MLSLSVLRCDALQTVGPLALVFVFDNYPTRWAGLGKLMGLRPGMARITQLKTYGYGLNK